MSKKSLIRNAALTVSILASGALVGYAQDPKPTVDPSEKSRNFKAEAKKVYQDWVNKDVEYIITSDEKKAFKALKTDEERENFIENFWRRRDPDPDTEENEFREHESNAASHHKQLWTLLIFQLWFDNFLRKY